MENKDVILSKEIFLANVAKRGALPQLIFCRQISEDKKSRYLACVSMLNNQKYYISRPEDAMFGVGNGGICAVFKFNGDYFIDIPGVYCKKLYNNRVIISKQLSDYIRRHFVPNNPKADFVKAETEINEYVKKIMRQQKLSEHSENKNPNNQKYTI